MAVVRPHQSRCTDLRQLAIEESTDFSIIESGPRSRSLVLLQRILYVSTG